MQVQFIRVERDGQPVTRWHFRQGLLVPLCDSGGPRRMFKDATPRADCSGDRIAIHNVRDGRPADGEVCRSCAKLARQMADAVAGV